MKRDLLVELGVEELPSSFLREGLRSMREAAEALLRDARLSFGSIETLGTPRRMALIIRGLGERQPDREERITGPAAKIAFTPEGELSKAALGFIQKNGGSPDKVLRVETEKGEYIALDIHEEGKLAEELLPASSKRRASGSTSPRACAGAITPSPSAARSITSSRSSAASSSPLNSLGSALKKRATGTASLRLRILS